MDVHHTAANVQQISLACHRLMPDGRTVRGKGNMAKKNAIPQKYQVWVEVRKQCHLSHTQIQMARELELNPKKFGSLAK